VNKTIRRERLRREVRVQIDNCLEKFLLDLTVEHIRTFGCPPSDAALCQALVVPMKARLICAKAARKSASDSKTLL
jgi:hypothetical protein